MNSTSQRYVVRRPSGTAITNARYSRKSPQNEIHGEDEEPADLGRSDPREDHARTSARTKFVPVVPSRPVEKYPARKFAEILWPHP